MKSTVAKDTTQENAFKGRAHHEQQSKHDAIAKSARQEKKPRLQSPPVRSHQVQSKTPSHLQYNSAQTMSPRGQQGRQKAKQMLQHAAAPQTKAAGASKGNSKPQLGSKLVSTHPAKAEGPAKTLKKLRSVEVMNQESPQKNMALKLSSEKVKSGKKKQIIDQLDENFEEKRKSDQAATFVKAIKDYAYDHSSPLSGTSADKQRDSSPKKYYLKVLENLQKKKIDKTRTKTRTSQIQKPQQPLSPRFKYHNEQPNQATSPELIDEKRIKSPRPHDRKTMAQSSQNKLHFTTMGDKRANHERKSSQNKPKLRPQNDSAVNQERNQKAEQQRQMAITEQEKPPWTFSPRIQNSQALSPRNDDLRSVTPEVKQRTKAKKNVASKSNQKQLNAKVRKIERNQDVMQQQNVGETDTKPKWVFSPRIASKERYQTNEEVERSMTPDQHQRPQTLNDNQPKQRYPRYSSNRQTFQRNQDISQQLDSTYSERPAWNSNTRVPPLRVLSPDDISQRSGTSKANHRLQGNKRDQASIIQPQQELLLNTSKQMNDSIASSTRRLNRANPNGKITKPKHGMYAKQIQIDLVDGRKGNSKKRREQPPAICSPNVSLNQSALPASPQSVQDPKLQQRPQNNPEIVPQQFDDDYNQDYLRINQIERNRFDQNSPIVDDSAAVKEAFPMPNIVSYQAMIQAKQDQDARTRRTAQEYAKTDSQQRLQKDPNLLRQQLQSRNQRQYLQQLIYWQKQDFPQDAMNSQPPSPSINKSNQPQVFSFKSPPQQKTSSKKLNFQKESKQYGQLQPSIYQASPRGNREGQSNDGKAQASKYQSKFKAKQPLNELAIPIRQKKTKESRKNQLYKQLIDGFPGDLMNSPRYQTNSNLVFDNQLDEEIDDGGKKRVAILGDIAVGKTSLFLRFLFKDHSDHANCYDSENDLKLKRTFQKDCLKFQKTINGEVKLEIIDFLNQSECLKSILESDQSFLGQDYKKKLLKHIQMRSLQEANSSDIILLVFDASRHTTFKFCSIIYSFLDEQTRKKVVLVANKMDKAKSPLNFKIMDFINTHQIRLFHVSCYRNLGLQPVFKLVDKERCYHRPDADQMDTVTLRTKIPISLSPKAAIYSLDLAEASAKVLSTFRGISWVQAQDEQEYDMNKLWTLQWLEEIKQRVQQGMSEIDECLIKQASISATSPKFFELTSADQASKINHNTFEGRIALQQKKKLAKITQLVNSRIVKANLLKCALIMGVVVTCICIYKSGRQMTKILKKNISFPAERNAHDAEIKFLQLHVKQVKKSRDKLQKIEQNIDQSISEIGKEPNKYLNLFIQSSAIDPSSIIKDLQHILKRENIVFDHASNEVVLTHLIKLKTNYQKLEKMAKTLSKDGENVKEIKNQLTNHIKSFDKSVKIVENIVGELYNESTNQLMQLQKEREYLDQKKRANIRINKQFINQMTIKCKKAFELYPDDRIRSRKGFEKIIGGKSERQNKSTESNQMNGIDKQSFWLNDDGECGLSKEGRHDNAMCQTSMKALSTDLPHDKRLDDGHLANLSASLASSEEQSVYATYTQQTCIAALLLPSFQKSIDDHESALNSSMISISLSFLILIFQLIVCRNLFFRTYPNLFSQHAFLINHNQVEDRSIVGASFQSSC